MSNFRLYRSRYGWGADADGETITDSADSIEEAEGVLFRHCRHGLKMDYDSAFEAASDAHDALIGRGGDDE